MYTCIYYTLDGLARAIRSNRSIEPCQAKKKKGLTSKYSIGWEGVADLM